MNLEWIIILLFAVVFLFLALAEPWEHKIVHPFPYSYLASDAFYHQATNEYINEQGIVTNTPPYTVGGHEGVVNAHPPMLFELTSSLSTLSGFPVYDSILIITVLSILFSILIIYFIWRQANKKIAILALPVCLLILQQRITPLIFWGYWLLIVGVLFMIASLWAITRFDLKFSYFAIALLLSAAALSHQPEFIYAGIFFALFLIVKVFKEKKLSKTLITKTVTIGLLILILSSYSLLIFSKTFLKTEGYRKAFDMEEARGGYPSFNLVHLGIAGIVALIGLVLFLFSKKRNIITPALISIFCFMLGLLIYIGLGKRAYAHRLFWVIYISFFFGFAIYCILNIFIKKKGIVYSIIASIIILLIFSQGIYGKTRIGPGIMNQYDWDALNWISKNVPEDSYVYYFYSDTLAHNAPLYNSKRIAFNIRINPFIESLKSQQIKRTYDFSLADGFSVYLHEKGFLSFCYFHNELKPKNETLECKEEYKLVYGIPDEFRKKDICNIEYYYFARASREPILAQYNMAIRNLLLNNNWIEEIYSNPLVSILKNNKPGVDCFGNYTQ